MTLLAVEIFGPENWLVRQSGTLDCIRIVDQIFENADNEIVAGVLGLAKISNMLHALPAKLKTHKPWVDLKDPSYVVTEIIHYVLGIIRKSKQSDLTSLAD